MKTARLWLLLAAVSSFVAGISVGLAAPKLGLHAAERAAQQDPDEQFIQQLTELCALDAGQVRLLRMILASHESELRDIRRRYYDQFPVSFRRESSMAGSRMDMRVLGMLKDPQRKSYQAINRPEQK